MKISRAVPALLLLSCFFFIQKIIIATDTITATQFLKDGEIFMSSGGTFEMGFFSPGSSNNRYFGIWYKKISNRTAVWVANRETPLNTASGVLKVIKPGLLVLLDETNNTVWSTNASISVHNPVAQLMDSGNLVVKDADDDTKENFLWQSFDYPSDTLLPGMKLGKNFVTGLDGYLSSWKNNDDPARGDYTYHIDPTGFAQGLLKKGPAVTHRIGPWNGVWFSGAPNLKNNSIATFGLVYNEVEAYYSYKLVNKSIISLFVLQTSGNAVRLIWVDRTQNWTIYHNSSPDDCDSYKLCGAYGSCNIENSPVCGCLDKFEPKNPNNWDFADWSDGCVRKTPLDCEKGDGFLKYSGIKLPDARRSRFNKSMTLQECERECLKSCSCMAYTNLDISKGGSGCLLWFADLVDIRVVAEDGQDLYIRMASSELVSQDGMDKKRREVLEVSLPLVTGMVLLGLSLILYVRRRKRKGQAVKKLGWVGYNYKTNRQYERGDFALPFFDLDTVTKATDCFSFNNKLGEGGFGPVYKGVLEEGREVAIKRLSQTSSQGLDEFKTEVNCIAKLQHRNLVKLLGFCVHGEERMLIYEYMPNKSLDSFIFDEVKCKVLDWPKRFHIINGIARGLQYLHVDSRLRIIHRDLKASNILLDVDMNPKISDFGLAKSFGGNETGANTKRVVGTYGYMSPEYQVDGLFSIKSDVFSFGVMVLEIVSGQKNRGFFHPAHNLNLLGHAWQLYKEGRSVELADAHLVDSCHIYEVLRSIHIGLLCVQQRPEDRPNMSSVVFMLGSEGVLPEAKHPGFYTERSAFEGESSSSSQAKGSINEFTITLLDAR